MSIATLLSQHHHVTAVDIIPEKVEMINNRKSPIQDDYIEKYLAEKNLDLTATMDAKAAYSDADFVVIAAFGINAINTCIVILGLIVIRLLTGWEYTLPFIALLVSELFLNHLQGVTRAIKQLRLYALANVVSTVGIAGCVTFFVLVLKRPAPSGMASCPL